MSKLRCLRAFAVLLFTVAVGVVTLLDSACATTRGAAKAPETPAKMSQPKTLNVYFLPVGQGDSTLLVAPDGAAMLVDGGGAFDANDPDPGTTVVGPFLRKLGIGQLDTMVMTHAHPDHIRGLLAIAAQWPITTLVHGGTELKNPDVQQLFALANDKGARLLQVGQTTHAVPWHGLELRFVHPRGPGGGPYEGRSLNDNSVVMEVTYHDRTLLLAADIETFGEGVMARRLGPVEVLKVAHHGGNTSSQPNFLDALRPQHAVISCGQNNPYGVPHAEVLQRLDKVGAKVWRTDVQGMIHFSTDGGPWQVKPDNE